MIKFLDLHQQYLSIKGEIDVAMEAVIRENAFIGGNYVKQFENEFSKYQQAGFCIGVGNGTDALEIAIETILLIVINNSSSFSVYGLSLTRWPKQIRASELL